MTSENQFWADKAALLDPACYQFVQGTTWERTVPAGKVWYLINSWALRHPENNYKWHHRNLDDPLQLPPGFVLSARNDFGYAYYADPSIVQANDTRYQTDPKALYYDRLERLRNIPLEHINVHLPKGLLATDPLVQQYNRAEFPVDANRIILRFVDCHDGCWVVLCKSDWSYAMNTQNELDDVRPMRLTKSMCVPILRDIHTHIGIGFASITGDPAQSQTYNGWGTAMFQRLPADW